MEAKKTMRVLKTMVLLFIMTVSASAMDRLDALWMIETGGQ